MTFHGRYRGADMDPHEQHHDEEHDEPLRGEDDTGHSQVHQHHVPKLEEVHESPLVMLVPLGSSSALGALFAGAAMSSSTIFVGEGAR